MSDNNDLQQRKIKSIDKIITIVSMVMLCIIPLIIFKKNITAFTPMFDGGEYATGQHIEMYNYLKSILLNIGSLSLLCMLIYKLVALKATIKKDYINIILMVLTIAIIISPIISEYTDIAIFGNIKRYEGSLAWTSYIIIFFVIYNINIEKKYIKGFFFVVAPFILLNLIIGSTISENPNQTSGIMAVIFLTTFMYILLEKNQKIKIALIITSVIVFTILAKTNTSSGYITIALTLPVLLAVGIRFTNIKNIATWTLITLIPNGLIYAIYPSKIGIISKINEISPIIIPGIIATILIIFLLIKLINRKIVFDILIICLLLVISMGAGKLSDNIKEEQRIIGEEITKAKKQSPNITQEEIEEIENSIEKIEDSKIYKNINEITSNGLERWIQTIDMASQKKPIVHGLDTSPYYTSVYDDKFLDSPSSWYLSIMYGTGIVGLIGLLSVVMYISRSVLYSAFDKINNKYIYIFGVGAIAYSLQGIFNDSTIGTSIIFWMFAGLALNQISSQTQERISQEEK
ncbi:MAG: O-antigen ligase family protein [Peptostreptococcaceae bacterium]